MIDYILKTNQIYKNNNEFNIFRGLTIYHCLIIILSLILSNFNSRYKTIKCINKAYKIYTKKNINNYINFKIKFIILLPLIMYILCQIISICFLLEKFDDRIFVSAFYFMTYITNSIELMLLIKCLIIEYSLILINKQLKKINNGLIKLNYLDNIIKDYHKITDLIDNISNVFCFEFLIIIMDYIYHSFTHVLVIRNFIMKGYGIEKFKMNFINLLIIFYRITTFMYHCQQIKDHVSTIVTAGNCACSR